jgi:DNA-binding CsgD family transcriptional regulator
LTPVADAGNLHPTTMRGYSLSARTLLQVLEVAHESTGKSWGTDLSGAIVRASGGSVVAAAVLRYQPEVDGLQPLHPVPSSLGHLIATGQGALSSQQVSQVYARRPTAVSASEVFAGRPPTAFRQEMRGLGLRDFVGVTAPLGLEGSFSLGLGLACEGALGASTRGRLAGLGMRLRTLWQVRDALQHEPPLPTQRCVSEAARMRAGQVERTFARALRVRGDDTAAEAINAWTALLHEGWFVASLGGAGGRHRVVLSRSCGSDDVGGLGLTGRERQVIDLVASALTNKEVAYELGLPESSVATILMRARQKLGVGSRHELVQLKRWLSDAGRPTA